MPRDRDTDGISVFRTLFVTARQIAEAGGSARNYYVCELPVRQFIDLDLTVIPKPDKKQPPGHSVVPELCADTKDEERTKEVAALLARAASDQIVFAPPD